ncbi:helix-turn-helix domain-containing protein [Fundicoccus culcitae]|uniref:Helix-turn-helix domain-containing protein n=1 Tax=Fundicoccus culcitae TaxID=2969821 RepID=A0ABY5P7M1_9LACT|nr:helix-turn-helix transcriptional regulator [Fundicoccus culcitae]UUX34669.1 helix-turn-helix domain-containing protein [Fundicoccus culcitae]
MNIERFVEARKAKGLNQNELADGICTQATLSRFENNGQAPSLKILIQLCHRLDLPLNELFPKVSPKYSDLIEKMDEAEFALIVSEYDKVEAIIQTIDTEAIDNEDIRLRYHYLKAFSMIYHQKDPMQILYEFDQINLSESTETASIYRLLAHTGTGMVYQQMGELEKAEFYFSKVLDKIYDYTTETMEDVWRVLHIVFQGSQFYASISEIEISNALAEHAISICADNHVTYYLARAALQLAKNAMATNEPTEKTLELIYDARAYSKINRNKIALAELEVMEQKIKQQ